jgi:antitoxin component of MazEF toxin-antitoxin module
MVDMVTVQQMGGNGSVGATIPADIAEELDIEKGTMLVVNNEEDAVRLQPVDKCQLTY